MKTRNRNPYRQPLLSQNFTRGLIGSALVLLGSAFIFLYVAFPAIVRSIIKSESRLISGSETWSKWANVTMPVFIRFYVFNVTNREAVLNGSRFNLEEVGPFVYEEKRYKQIVSEDDADDSVTYKDVVTYYFRPDLSIGSDEEPIFDVVNVPFVAAATLIQKHLDGYPMLANFVVDYFVNEHENLVLQGVKPRDLIFNGVKLNPIYETLADYDIVDLPDEFIGDTFALYNGKNGTPTLDFKVNRGIKDGQSFGQIMSYDGKNELSWWTNKSLPEGSPQHCNKLNGSDGSVFPPFVDKGKPLYVHPYEICRSLAFGYDHDVSFHGIPAYKYKLPEIVLEHPDVNENNRCFAISPGNGLADYLAKGLMRIFSCKRDIPIFISFPHFLQSSDFILDWVSGMKPNKTMHESEIVVEPLSGSMLKVVKRLQVSVELQPFHDITAFEGVHLAVVPIAWVEEHAELDEASAEDLRSSLIVPFKIAYILQWVVLGTLVSTLVLVIFCSFRVKRTEASSQQISVVTVTHDQGPATKALVSTTISST